MVSLQVFCSGCGAALPEPPPCRCPACGMDHWLDAKPCGAMLLTDRGRLLMIRRGREPWRGKWDLPGGFCGTTEHPILAAERETLEEVGIVARVTGLLGMWIDAYPDGSRQNKTTLCAYFHGVPVDSVSARVCSPEIDRVAWFEPHDLPEDLSFPGHVPAVLDAWRTAFLAGRTESPLPDRPHRSGR